MPTFHQLDELVHSLARAREFVRKQWEIGLLDGAQPVWEDEVFFAANECLTEAIVTAIRARDNAEVKS